MNSKFVVLCLPMNGAGHINASIGLCLALQRNGHRIVFGVEKTWRGKFVKHGFEEETYEERETSEDEKPLQFVIQEIEKYKTVLRSPPDKQVEEFGVAFQLFTNSAKYSNKRIQEIIEAVKPDVIIQDHYVAIPAIINSGVPFVLLYSCNPLYAIDCESLPPIGFGLPLDDDSDWQRCRQLRIKSFEDIWKSFNKWVTESGAPSLPEHSLQYKSPFLNVLMYPKALFEDYAKRVKLGKEWMIIEHAIRDSAEEFELPEEFKRKPGKLVYLSLGSMMSADVDLMDRLLSILSKSPHKFIVSKGLQHEKINLAHNMWGESYVPQLKILSLCDLFITHGGNNSLTEALYFGVPLIVMPVFTDQHDNAQRVAEMKIGARLNTFNVTEDELLSTIDSMLCDDLLYKRLKIISDQMKGSTAMIEVTQRIEQIAINHRSH